MTSDANPFGNTFNSDGEAIQFLESRKFLCKDGSIIPPGLDYDPKKDETMAIKYLADEWSWTYEKISSS